MRIRIAIMGKTLPAEEYVLTDEQHTLLCTFAATLQDAKRLKRQAEDFLEDVGNSIEEMAEVVKS